MHGVSFHCQSSSDEYLGIIKRSHSPQEDGCRMQPSPEYWSQGSVSGKGPSSLSQRFFSLAVSSNLVEYRQHAVVSCPFKHCHTVVTGTYMYVNYLIYLIRVSKRLYIILSFVKSICLAVFHENFF